MAMIFKQDILQKAQEMEKMIKLAKRQLLEFEVLMSLKDIREKKTERYSNSKKLLKNLV